MKKTIFAEPGGRTPTLVFVAGLEGTGHHMFSKIGAEHSTEALYKALSQYLGISAQRKGELEYLYAPARRNLTDIIRGIGGSNEENVVFLNTVWVGYAVNMYSYPWGSPLCKMKRFARIACNIDLLELARLAEQAGVDFRVIFLKRQVGASVVSSSINRNFGTFISQTRQLGISRALLETSLEHLDPRFYKEFSYEKFLTEPENESARLIEHLNVPPQSSLAQNMHTQIQTSATKYGSKNLTAWMDSVNPDRFIMMNDLLNL